MGTIAQEITRLQTAKADIKTAIEAKGVTVPSSALISDYDTYVSQITGGGSQPVLTTLTATENGTYTPGVGTDGYNQVIVNVQQIHEFDDASYLFYRGRLIQDNSALLSKFTGVTMANTFSFMTISGSYAKASTATNWIIKTIQNSADLQQTNYSTVSLGGVFSSSRIDQTDKTLSINISAIQNATGYSHDNRLNVNDMLNTNSTADFFDDITLNLLTSSSANCIFLNQGFGRIRCTGNVKLYSFFNSNGTFQPINYNISEGGNLYEFCLIPTTSLGTLNMSTLSDTMDENTILRSLDLYEDSSWWTGKKLTIKLPSLLFSNLQQSTITAASNLGITLKS